MPTHPSSRTQPLPSRVTFKIAGQTFTGEGLTRLEAFAVAVEQAAPLLREALRAKRAREAGQSGGRA